jgi:GT2 family glycosyltransferase
MEANLSPPRVAVVIVNAKGTKDLVQCLDSVKKTNYPNFQIIVVDCLSKDIEKLRKIFEHIKFIHYDDDIGASESHNVGVLNSDSNCEYIAFLDNDTIVNPDWITEAVEVLKKDPTVGAVQCKLLLMRNPSVFDGAGDMVNYYGETVYARGSGQKDIGQFDKVENIFSARGAGVVVQKNLYEKIGGFDQSFFIYLDDVDFGWRVWLAGYRVVFAPSSIVYHGGAVTTNKSFYSQFNRAKNQYFMLIKNFSLFNLRYLSIFLLRDFFSIFYYVSRRDRVSFVGLKVRIKVFYWLIKNFGLIWKKRESVQHRVRVISDDALRIIAMVPPEKPFLKQFLSFIFKSFK